MGKNKKIAIMAIAIAVIITAIVASYYLTASVQTGLLPSGNPPQWQMEVTGEFTTETTLAVEDLAQMPLTNVTHTIKEETATYIGVTLLEFLNRTGASWDAGLINVIATDGYTKTINLYQAWNSTQYPHSEIILAFMKDGEWMTSDNGGPIQLITPGLASAYNVKNVVALHLDAWAINVAGTVSNPLVITGENITDFETKTVQAAFAPGGEPQRTSDWTGADLWAVLQTAGISETASKVTVTAIDGYAQDFTVTQVKDLGILIGYKENGEYFTPNAGQPFRLIIPDEEYKWGQYWVRWVSQVEVS
jgi:DMSO/TMAO reductase YedYZ molybdopterin-dependent catalytic subunit